MTQFTQAVLVSLAYLSLSTISVSALCTKATCGGIAQSGLCSCSAECLFQSPLIPESTTQITSCCSNFAMVCPEELNQSSCVDSCDCTCLLPVSSKCSCDPRCEELGNCCEGYADKCEATCDGRCGSSERTPSGCYCDAQCLDNGDCCADAASKCPDVVQPTCKGYCTGFNAICFCDSLCESYGDCCDDYKEECEEQGLISDSCAGNCYTNAGLCFCDAACVAEGDCCDDFEELCPLLSSCNNNGTSPAMCGEFIGMCGCDAKCTFHNDCCSDFFDVCLDSSSGVMPELEDAAKRFNFCNNSFIGVNNLITSQSSSTPLTSPILGSCGYAAGNCWCDTECTFFNDCCEDALTFCASEFVNNGVPTTDCDGRCGEFLDGCWCDELCGDYGDCCPGIELVCPFQSCTTGTETFCGRRVLGCYCDPECTFFNDCCQDTLTVCGITKSPTQDSCVGNCGKSAGGCFCDFLCTGFNDCCDDYDICAQSVPSPTCANNCFGSFNQICYCDELCSLYEDCCEDIYTECPGLLLPDLAPSADFEISMEVVKGPTCKCVEDFVLLVDVRISNVTTNIKTLTLQYESTNQFIPSTVFGGLAKSSFGVDPLLLTASRTISIPPPGQGVDGEIFDEGVLFTIGFGENQGGEYVVNNGKFELVSILAKSTGVEFLDVKITGDPVLLTVDCMSEADIGFPGDLNADGVISILDVVQLSTIILNNEGDATSCQTQSGDLNNDEILSILDIIPLAQLVVA